MILQHCKISTSNKITECQYPTTYKSLRDKVATVSNCNSTQVISLVNTQWDIMLKTAV